MSIVKAARKTLAEQMAVPAVVTFILVFIFIYANWDAVMPARSPDFPYTRSTLTIYAVMISLSGVVFIFYQRARGRVTDFRELVGIELVDHAVGLAAGGLLTGIILFLVYEWLLGLRVPEGRFSLENAAFWGVVTMQFSIIAPSEEILFRYMWPKMLGGITAQAFFAVFHWGVFGGDLNQMAFVFVLGLVWWTVMMAGQKYRALNLSFNIGSHAIFNTMAYLYAPLAPEIVRMAQSLVGF